MVQGYYVLQEAAQVLGMSVDELKAIAQKNQIRSFQDRGTLRFRIQDIQELQRQRLGNSDPELVLGDAISPRPVPAGSPKTPPVRTPKPGSGVKSADVVDFDVDDSVEIGKEPLPEGSAARKSKSGPKSGTKLPAKPGSDSDVKLVADGSDSFSIQLGDDLAPSTGDSDVRLGDLSTNKKVGGSSSRASKSGVGRRSSKMGPSPADSGVRLVPMDDSGSGVRLDSAPTESDVRLDRSGSSKRLADQPPPTEDINLDEEIKKLESTGKKPETKFQTTPSMFGKPGAAFELSEHDLDDKPTRATERSSDFEIDAGPAFAGPNLPASGPKTPAPKSPKSPKPKKKTTEFDLLPSADSDEDFSLSLDEESLDLGAEPTGSAPKSGINLSHPSDKGISLESPAADDDDFELSLDEAPPTPKPAKKKPVVEDDSDFELSLDDDSGESPSASDSSDDSEFELDLDGDTEETSSTDDSDFELALDDDKPAKKKPAAKSKSKKTIAAKDADVLDSDFDLPDLDDSGAETVDADSSDFELALDDTDIGAEDESGSQVVALEEEEYEEGGETVDGDLDEYEDGDVEEEEGAEIEERVVVQEVLRDRWVKPAPWGVMPVVFMLPCVIVMLLVGVMGWELIQTSSGYRSSGLVTRWVADTMGIKTK